MKKTIFLTTLAFCLFSSMALADLKFLDTAGEFEMAIANAPADVPVMVQFSAYWCGPCERLKETLTELAPNYSDEQILIYYVDAYKNSSLQTYLKGGYPTVRIFKGGALQEPYFIGAKSPEGIRRFIQGLLSGQEVRTERASAELEILDSADDFQKVISKSSTPVMVSFSAYWCGPCQRLKARLTEMAPSYNKSDIRICYVDAYKNSSLKKYLKGGYPTVRVFEGGQLQDEYFIGAKSESFIRNFIDNLIAPFSAVDGGKLKILENEQEFRRLLSKSSTPVMVSFSAYWCGPCQKLKEKLKTIAPQYTQEQIQICYVDAHVNSSLKEYLKGGYPTVRAFEGGKLLEDTYFLGNQPEGKIHAFIKELIRQQPSAEDFSPIKE